MPRSSSASRSGCRTAKASCSIAMPSTRSCPPTGARARGASTKWWRSSCANARRSTCGATTATSVRPARRRRPDVRILLLGASGFIGRELAAALTQRGYRIVAAVRDPASAPALACEEAIAVDLNRDTRIDAWLPRLARIDVADLAQTVALALESDRMVRRTLEPVGPDVVTLRDILRNYRRWLGYGEARIVEMPAWIVGIACKLGDLAGGPLNSTSRAQLR